MKIFSVEQIRRADRFTIENVTKSSLALMENAAESCVSWLKNHLPNNTKFAIFCGNGNNGGDGLAMARLLYQAGYDTEVFIDFDNEKRTQDSAENLRKVREISGILVKDFSETPFEFPKNVAIVDAIFGSGINNPLSGKIEALVLKLNELKNRKIAIDLPSGLYSDDKTPEGSTILKADETLSLLFWKKAMLHPESEGFTGKIHILNIGISGDFIHREETEEFVICRKLIKQIYRPRLPFSHKGTYGTACIVGGSYGKMGAEVLATKAALRAGAGLTFSVAPEVGNPILQSSCPEAMFISGGENFINKIPVEEHYTLGIGPGLGKNRETAEAFLGFLKNYKRPLVLDADALNIIAEHQNYLEKIPENSIITPHPKEFERLFGKTQDSFERLNLAKEKAKSLGIIIVLKDHRTQIVNPDGRVFYNITGNPGMAKGGSGDVLTGIITALLAQKYSPLEATVFGVWLHGTAGDFAAQKFSKEAMLPSDLISEIGNVFRSLKTGE